MDRDTKFLPLREFLETCTVIEPVLLPPKSPNCNAYLERFFLSLKSDCVDRMIFFGEASLRNALSEFVTHYHTERNHQGLDNNLIDAGGDIGETSGVIECHERLGGLLRYYRRRAASSVAVGSESRTTISTRWPTNGRNSGRCSISDSRFRNIVIVDMNFFSAGPMIRDQHTPI